MLTLVVSGAYFLNPEIQRSFEYHGRAPHPIDADAPPDYLEDDLLGPVLRRGPIYRATE